MYTSLMDWFSSFDRSLASRFDSEMEERGVAEVACVSGRRIPFLINSSL